MAETLIPVATHSPPGSLTVPTAFPLRPASSAVNVRYIGNGLLLSNPQLDNSCSSLWQGNSYCFQAVGNINTYAGYSTTSWTAYTTLASTINLSATVTANRTTTSVTQSSEATSTASSSVNTSPDGTCGESTGYSCTNSQFGNCCSKFGYCGSTSDYCETNCDPAYGECKASSIASSLTPTSASTATPTSTANISPNGLCGANNGGYTCLNSQFGNCCSLYGYCGSTSDYCASQSCDSSYGECSAQVRDVRTLVYFPIHQSQAKTPEARMHTLY
ncbi:uncharacterized protein BO87DRAFT_420217 [Aspergillus neoniger CBS 115656]|uniref:Chitin-binding type-1 domain-containing protein n=1 Tax=Aspergillus neoniger (strain CBS 115656) TaxID=1448310 RepID=A0A318Y2V5_ASPNB|nr:hypothetical protein BO87DRAFT_420217 [Aspergillus neoniger CBS 115656]PYH28651.1 hypothetical protein BO87DRAFT_420217 [Aspergillus neoniger CBS 115656]